MEKTFPWTVQQKRMLKENDNLVKRAILPKHPGRVRTEYQITRNSVRKELDI